MTDNIQIIWNSNNGFFVKFYGECSDEYISRLHKFLIKYEVFKATDKVTHTVRTDLSMFRGSNYRDISFVKTFFDIIENKPAPVIEVVPQIIEPNETITKLDPLLDLKKLIRQKIIKKNEYLGSSDSELSDSSSESENKDSPKGRVRAETFDKNQKSEAHQKTASKVMSKASPKTAPKVTPKTVPKTVPKTAPKVSPKTAKITPKIIPKVVPKATSKQSSKTAPQKMLTKNVSKEFEQKQLSLLEQESSSLDINSSDIPTQSGSGDDSELGSDETSSGSYETESTEESSESESPIKPTKGGRKK